MKMYVKPFEKILLSSATSKIDLHGGISFSDGSQLYFNADMKKYCNRIIDMQRVLDFGNRYHFSVIDFDFIWNFNKTWVIPAAAIDKIGVLLYGD